MIKTISTIKSFLRTGMLSPHNIPQHLLSTCESTARGGVREKGGEADVLSLEHSWLLCELRDSNFRLFFSSLMERKSFHIAANQKSHWLLTTVTAYLIFDDSDFLTVTSFPPALGDWAPPGSPCCTHSGGYTCWGIINSVTEAHTA